MWFYFVICLIILILYYSLRTDPPPLYGKYSQPGKWYWFKYSVFYILLLLKKFNLIKSSNPGYGKKARNSLDELDDIQKLSEHPLAIDAAYFNGFNSDGYYFGAGIQRRPKGKVESLLFIRVPNLGILEWPFSPSTATQEGEKGFYGTEGGLKFIKKVAMKVWNVTFDGQLQIRETKKLARVQFDLTWAATTEWFDFDTDMHSHPVCQAIAREPWNQEFFERLRDAHQTHHEQFGTLKGKLKVNVDGEDKEFNLELKSMRDHSYGLYRKWADFNRYILQYFSFENGLNLAVHLVSLKPTMTHFITGFLVYDNSKKKIPIYSCDRPLYSIGENGQPPAKYEFKIVAEGEEYLVECEKVDMPQYFCGWEKEGKIYPFMCKAKINGIPGRGMCEFEYFNENGN